MDICITQNNKSAFTSRNIEIRKADEIVRRVHKEFPVYSNTSMQRFKTLNNTKSTKRLYRAITDLITELRSFYNISTDRANFFRMLAGIKESRVGNCFEQARLTEAALLMNGYKDVRKFFLFAYNPQNGMVKDLDHTLVGINIKLPPYYLIRNVNNDFVSPESLILPNNKSIIVDRWAGIADDSRTALTKYKGNVHLSTHPNPNYKILLLPAEKASFEPGDILYLKKHHPNLLLDENKKDIDKIYINESWYNLFKYNKSIVREVKKQNKLISSGYKKPISFYQRIKNLFAAKNK